MKLVIVIPAHNEESIIRDNVEKIIKFMKYQKGYEWRIIVAENNSGDNTLKVLKDLAKNYPKKVYSYFSFNIRSKSDAIKNAWLSCDADIYMHMDADLSTDLTHIPELVKWIEEGYDIAVGSRVIGGAQVERSLKRDILSYGYNVMTKLLFGLNVKDLQCGFKAINKRTLNEIIKQTKYMSEGFMDTEMLILATKKGFKIKEIPVKWKDDRESKFNLYKVAVGFIKNIINVKLDLIRGRYII